MKGLNLSQFKKISSDSKSTTLKHPEGHKIVIAHHALSPQHKKQLSEIPTKYAEGGDVEESRSPASLLYPEEAQAASDKKLSISSKERAALNAVREKEGPLPSDSMGPVKPDPTVYEKVNNFLSMPGEQEAEAAKQWQQGLAVDRAKLGSAQLGPSPASTGQPVVANQDPFGYGAMAEGMLAGVNQEKAGAMAAAAAAAQEGKLQELAAKQQEKALNDFKVEHEKQYAALNAERQALLNDYKAGHINANHYVESMSSGKKALTAIGLILGGMGGGLTGQGNAAQDFLNKQIDRDIESQKATMGKNQNLLSANAQAFGNLKDAEMMTRIQLNDLYSSKVAQAAAASMGSKAQANAQMYIGQKNMESAQLQQQLAMRRAGISGLTGNSDPASKIRMGVMSGIIPKEETEHLYKELEDAEGLVKARDNALSAFDKVAQLNTVGNRLANPIQAKRQIEAIQEPLIAQLSKDTAGKFTSSDAEMLRHLFTGVTDDSKTIASNRRQIEKLISQKMNFPRLQAYGINPSGGQRYDSSGQKRIQLGPPVK
jgi:hypothetical protein